MIKTYLDKVGVEYLVSKIKKLTSKETTAVGNSPFPIVNPSYITDITDSNIGLISIGFYPYYDSKNLYIAKTNVSLSDSSIYYRDTREEYTDKVVTIPIPEDSSTITLNDVVYKYIYTFSNGLKIYLKEDVICLIRDNNVIATGPYMVNSTRCSVLTLAVANQYIVKTDTSKIGNPMFIYTI